MDYKCTRCEAAFISKPSARRQFCSEECYRSARNEGANRTCAVCGNAFVRRASIKGEYCSKRCSGLAQRQRIAKVCEHCGKAFEVNPSRAVYARFCSKSCRAKALSVGIYIAVPLRGGVTAGSHYQTGGWRKRASRVRKRDNYTCQICLKQFIKGTNKLHADHKIPLRLGGTDDLDNLWALCDSCHTKKDAALRSIKSL